MQRLCKLSFDPNVYPPPKNMKEGHNSGVFNKLRNYIENSARDDGSLVICNGGSNPHKKRFRCGHWHHNTCPSFKKLRQKCSLYHEEDGGENPYNYSSCTFSFVLKWDETGYYTPSLVNITNFTMMDVSGITVIIKSSKY